jgi:hypothetical protein
LILQSQAHRPEFMNKKPMKTNEFTDKQNTKVRTNRATGSRLFSVTTQRKKAIKTRNCLNSAELARQQALKTRYCLSSAELARRKTIKTTNCLSSAELARRKTSKTTNCLSSAEPARRRARPTETANRLSTVLSPNPLGLSLARQNKHTPKKYKNCHDSCLSSFSANLSKRGEQNNFHD